MTTYHGFSRIVFTPAVRRVPTPAVRRVPTVFADYGLDSSTKRILAEIMPAAVFVPVELDQPDRCSSIRGILCNGCSR